MPEPVRPVTIAPSFGSTVKADAVVARRRFVAALIEVVKGHPRAVVIVALVAIVGVYLFARLH